jgi:predicted secreted hydrolase
MFPATLSVAAETFSYELSLSSKSDFQLQGDNGYSVKSADGKVASHYYSQPFIDVMGSIQVEGQTHQVTGQAWIDREWSSRFLLGSQQGWDWFALRLDTDTSLVVFQLRDNQTGEANYAYGRLMFSGREGITIGANELSLKVRNTTVLNGQPHPTSWQLDIPTHELFLTIDAINPNAKMPLTIPYWEGPVQIKGSHEGLGYMELTGY